MANPLRRAGTWCLVTVKGVVRRSVRDDVTATASQFAYNAFLATVPFLFVLVSVIGLVADENTYDRLIRDYGDSIPQDLQDVLRAALSQATDNSRQAVLFLVLGLVGSLYVAANVICTLNGAMDRALGVPSRSWLRGKLVGMAYAAVASVLVVIGTLAVAGGPRLVDALARYFSTGQTARDIATRSVYPIAALMFSCFTLLLYRFGPNAAPQPMRALLPATVIAVGGWMAATTLFGAYVGRFESYDAVYGSLGIFVVYMIFLFLTGLMLVIGGEVVAEIAKRP